MKYLYLVQQPLVKRDFSRFGIEFFLDKGHDVTVLDLSDLLYPDISNDRSKVVQDSRMTLRIVQNRDELKAEKKTFAENDLIFLLIHSLGLSRSTYPVLKIIAKTGAPYLLLAPAIYPGLTKPPAKMSWRKSLKHLFFKLEKMDLLNSVFSRLPRQWLGIPEANYIIYNGHASQAKNSLVGKETIPIFAHTIDYDIYRRHAETDVDVENQAVFIDQYLPYQPDLVSYKIEGMIDPDLYYGQLRNFFDRIESKLNLKVAIVGHPRSEYQRFKDVFGDREIHYEDTIGQIAKSRLILAHFSTAIGLAVLYRKPIMLLTTPELYEFHPSHKHLYEGFSKDLGVPLKYFDKPDDVDLSGFESVNDNLYDKYIHNYIKAPEAPEKHLWDIVHDAIGAEQSGQTN